MEGIKKIYLHIKKQVSEQCLCYHVGKKDKSFTLYIQNKLFGKIHKTEIVGCLLQNKLNN